MVGWFFQRGFKAPASTGQITSGWHSSFIACTVLFGTTGTKTMETENGYTIARVGKCWRCPFVDILWDHTRVCRLFWSMVRIHTQRPPWNTNNQQLHELEIRCPRLIFLWSNQMIERCHLRRCLASSQMPHHWGAPGWTTPAGALDSGGRIHQRRCASGIGDHTYVDGTDDIYCSLLSIVSTTVYALAVS